MRVRLRTRPLQIPSLVATDVFFHEVVARDLLLCGDPIRLLKPDCYIQIRIQIRLFGFQCKVN